MLSFSLLALVLTGTVSCSSDDNSSEKQKMQTLELSSLNGTNVEVNASVTFTVAIGTTAVEDAHIYVNGKQSTNPFTFTEVGSYKVVAKKEGYNDSNEITITVTEAGNTKTLVLEASKSNVAVDEQVAFTVKDGENTVTDADLYIGSTKISTPYIFTTAGEYQVVAKKQGFQDSNIVTITVEEAADTGVIGTWIPVNVKVTIFGEVMDMPYPKQEDCDDDTLTFKNNQTVTFEYHDESCVVNSTGAAWSINEAGSVLNLNLFDQAMTVNVISNDATTLVFGAKGDQFEALIPILVPELASSIPSGMLGMIDVQLELNKQ